MNEISETERLHNFIKTLGDIPANAEGQAAFESVLCNWYAMRGLSPRVSVSLPRLSGCMIRVDSKRYVWKGDKLYEPEPATSATWETTRETLKKSEIGLVYTPPPSLFQRVKRWFSA
jgi:hypothetical protein